MPTESIKEKIGPIAQQYGVQNFFCLDQEHVGIVMKRAIMIFWYLAER